MFHFGYGSNLSTDFVTKELIQMTGWKIMATSFQVVNNKCWQWAEHL